MRGTKEFQRNNRMAVSEDRFTTINIRLVTKPRGNIPSSSKKGFVPNHSAIRFLGAVSLCALPHLIVLQATPPNPPPAAPIVSLPTLSTNSAAQGKKSPPGMQASPLESTNILRSFATRGVIREFPEGGKTVVIRHEEIPGFMPKMTMEFELRDPKEINGLAVGDNVIFNIRATQDDSWIDGLRRAGTNDLIDATPKDPSSTALLHVATLKPGDPMPDAQLLAEDGRTIRFSDYKGKALAFTFIFTRCPLPNYCPRMNVNFKEARELLLVNVDGPSNWEFLSISFDPEFDKPGVLNRYAFSYRGTITNQWVFAAAPKDTLAAMSPQLDFRFANEQGSFQHNLRTVVLDAKGRVHRYFEGNKWTPEELATAISEAAQKTL